MNEKSFIELLSNQYKVSENKEKIDYWEAISNLIMESLEIRNENSISQKDLAKTLKTKQSVISRFENMGRLPNYDFLSRLAIGLGDKLGATLYGSFMAVVPLKKQNLVLEQANKQNISTNEYVQKILEKGIEKEKKYIEEAIIFDTTSSSSEPISNFYSSIENTNNDEDVNLVKPASSFKNNLVKQNNNQMQLAS